MVKRPPSNSDVKSSNSLECVSHIGRPAPSAFCAVPSGSVEKSKDCDSELVVEKAGLGTDSRGSSRWDGPMLGNSKKTNMSGGGNMPTFENN